MFETGEEQMNILVTLQKGKTFDIYFPSQVTEELSKLGNIRYNMGYKPFTKDEMAMNIKDADICLTHWGCPLFSREVLDHAENLKLIAHAAGSVAYMVTDDVYRRNIKVCSANSIMAKYVAEGVLSYILSAFYMIPYHDSKMKSGVIWEQKSVEIRSLYGEKIGMIGLGTVGMYLLKLLEPFKPRIKIFDPYLSKDILETHPEIELCSMEEVLEWGNIISIHASLTSETFHMMNREKLGLMKDNVLFVNTSRGAIIDEKALADELQSGRFRAVLDVFEEEPLPLNSPLRNMGNVILMPHVAGSASKEVMTMTMLEEIKRFIQNKPLKYEIPYEKYRLMTRE